MSLELKPLIAKLNSSCRQAFERAAELCVSQGNYSVEIEHLLLKLLDNSNSDIVRVLRYYDVDIATLNRELNRALERLKRGNTRTPTMSPYILALLKEAWMVSSLQFGSHQVRSGGILMALTDHDTLRGTMLELVPSLMRIPRESLRQDIQELIKGSGEDQQEKASAPASNKSSSAKSDTANSSKVTTESPNLDQYTIDLTEEARRGRIDTIEGRDTEIRQIIDILTRRRQNNPILTGEAGVGKTAVVEGFALRIAKGDVPPALQNVVVRTLDLGLLQAGAGVKGEFENRIKSVITEVKSSPQPIILFIDEAHTLIGAGGTAGQGDAANLLKPALARGELRTIAATTWAEYKKYFEKDPALTRRFQVVKVDEPSPENAINMLRGTVKHLEQHHGVLILDEAVRDAVNLSARYITGRQLPDKAISVLDTACARVAIAQNSEPPALESARRRINRSQEELKLLQREQATGHSHAERLEALEKQLEQLEGIRKELELRWRQELEAVQKIRDLERKLEQQVGAGELPSPKIQAQLDEIKKHLAGLQKQDPMIPACVDGQIVAMVISGWTGIPVGKMMTNSIRTILNIKEKMAQRILGQDDALETISRRLKTYHADLDDPGKPVGVFMLVGPSGVGKTETALSLAEDLFGGEHNVITINMSEYQEAHTVSALKGAPPGYVGHGKGGVLTEAVRRTPYSVVLLDEVEKAHPDVLEVFYQVFDKGMMDDGDGVSVDFKNTVILLTSNLGTDTLMQQMRNPMHGFSEEELRKQLQNDLLKHFKPAFLSRLVVVPYNPLGDEQIRRIVRLKLNKVAVRFEENHRASLTYDEPLIEAVLSRCTEVDSGARNIDHILTHTLLPALSIEILERMAQGLGFSCVHLSCDEQGEIRYHFDTELALSAADDNPGEGGGSGDKQLLGDLDSLLDWLKSN